MLQPLQLRASAPRQQAPVLRFASNPSNTERPGSEFMNKAVVGPDNLSPANRALLPLVERVLREIDSLTSGPDKFSPTSVLNRLYQQLHPRERGVVVYGSSRPVPGTEQYQDSVDIGAAIGKLKKDGKRFFVVTGGGPGAMRGAAEGAKNAGAHTVGCAMNFVGEEPSSDVHSEMAIHPNFSERIDGWGGYHHRGAYSVAVKGGLGTDFEIIKQLQALYFNSTEYPCQKQIVLYDKHNFFSAPGGLVDHVNYMIKEGVLSAGARDILKLGKTPDECAAFLLDQSIPWTPGTKAPATNPVAE